MKKPVCAGMISVALAGCASAPVHYYSLLPPAAQSVSAAPARYALDILPVGIPPEEDRPEWIERNPDGSVGILTGSQWAAPLGQELGTALSAQLETRAGVQLVDAMAPSNLPVLRLKLSIRRFDIAPDHPTDITADWSLGAPGKPHLLCTGHFTTVAAHTDAAALTNIRRWVETLAGQIGKSISSWNADAATLPACPSDQMRDQGRDTPG